MGDSYYWRIVKGLTNSEEPALRVTGKADKTTILELTAFGERLLRSEADWLAVNPAERWVGGVRIDPREKHHWRFDENQNAVARR
jgi:hypothetical protein